MAIGDFEVVSNGDLGAGGEFTPVQYPRSGDERDIGIQYKGAASQGDNINDAIATNTTGDVNVPRHADEPIDYAYGMEDAMEDDEK